MPKGSPSVNENNWMQRPVRPKPVTGLDPVTRLDIARRVAHIVSFLIAPRTQLVELETDRQISASGL